jgi:tRNA threonylcarbamoyl adenosine modification protein (Sua5/YciO/YrdC/YwlC family)
MMLRYAIHPKNPQRRLLEQISERLLAGDILIYPSDTTYSLGCLLGNKRGMDRIRQIRGLDDHHDFSLICPSLSSLATYAHVENQAFKILKRHLPGPYTFILKATKAVPKAFMQAKKLTIGLRVPESILLSDLLEVTGEPLVSVTLQLDDQREPMSDPDEIEKRLDKLVDIFIDAGRGGVVPSSVIDLTGSSPEVIREGLGDVAAFES